MPTKLDPISLPEPSKDASYSVIDPLDGRYYDAEAAKYLSEDSRVAYQAYVEAALALTLADFGICTPKIAKEIEKSARKVTAKAVYEEERITKHDIKALVNVIKQGISPEAQPYVHYGATSYDIVSTAIALQMRDAINYLVLPKLRRLVIILIDLSEEYAYTVQIGRTHGQHAVPITFGFALAEYVSRLCSSVVATESLTGELCGKFSGAVGAYNAISLFVDLPIEFEAAVLTKLGLEPAEYSNQIVPPELLIRLLDELTIAAGIMANLAHDMRHLQRSEIAEVRERFEKNQTGSSTMAHKRNPINFENVISMHKQVLAQCLNANLNISSEHHRDLTDSASSRFYGTALAGVAVMADRLGSVMGKLEIDEEAMQKNLYLSGGTIAAEPLYLLFEKYGHTTAHEKAKELSLLAADKKIKLTDVVKKDPEASKYWKKFSVQEKEIVEDPEIYYTGLAAAKANDIAKKWRQQLS
jgi:adenylosuccinate lyase